MGSGTPKLFTRRREMRRAAEVAGVTLPVAATPEPEPFFVPATVEPEPVAAVAPAPAAKKKRVRRSRPGTEVELLINRVTVKIARGADAGVAAIFSALQRHRFGARSEELHPDQLALALALEEADQAVARV